MFTRNSILIYLGSLIVAEATFLYSAGIHTWAELLSLPLVLQMVITAGTVTAPWASYSPLFKPLGAPQKP